MTKLFLLSICLFSLSFATAKVDKKIKATDKIYTAKDLEEKAYELSVAKLEKVKNRNIVSFSKDLLLKEQKIKLKEFDLFKREEELKINIKGFEKKLAGFKKRQTNFIGCINKQDSLKNKRVEHMVDVVSGMKPSNAANILSVQDVDISIKILSLLKPEKVSKIFNLMDKEISARLQKQYMNMKR